MTDEIEAVARALFEADEDLIEISQIELRVHGAHAVADALGPRPTWDDPRNAPILSGYRFRARAAIAALDAARGARKVQTCPRAPYPFRYCPGCTGGNDCVMTPPPETAP